MAPLTADDLLASGGGELELDWFAPLDSSAASARLNEWLNKGYAKGASLTDSAQKDDLAKANAYYESYKNIASVLARSPAVMTVVEGSDTTSRTYSAAEIQHFVDLRDSWKGVLDALSPVPPPASDFTPTMSVRARFGF